VHGVSALNLGIVRHREYNACGILACGTKSCAQLVLMHETKFVRNGYWRATQK
jgi:hypothetical protein